MFYSWKIWTSSAQKQSVQKKLSECRHASNVPSRHFTIITNYKRSSKQMANIDWHGILALSVTDFSSLSESQLRLGCECVFSWLKLSVWVVK